LLHAQGITTDTTVATPPGKLWGLVYGDYAYKMKSDSLNRGGLNQYTGIKENESLFQFRRVYLGYSYDISSRFSADFLLALEDNMETNMGGTPVLSGSVLGDGKLGLFIKLANLKYKNVFKGSDLSFGEVYTPAAVLVSETLWEYRCIERTISEIRRTPAWDLGVSLNGKIYNTTATEVGYNAMIGNGTASRPENKTFYGDIYAKLFNKKLVIDLYADYSKIDWTAQWHHDRSMAKAIVAYTTPKLTIGAEGFINSLMNDNMAKDATTGKTDTITTQSMGISVFARGRIYKEKLGFYVRYDTYDPSLNNDNKRYASYSAVTRTYNTNTKEQFFTLGLDYSPMDKVHILPNIWYNAYNNSAPTMLPDGTDLVLRMSIYYIYGK